MAEVITASERELRIRQRTCQSCGMLCDDRGEFHPFMFCVLKKAGRDPWEDFSWCVERLGLGKLPDKPPLVRNLRD